MHAHVAQDAFDWMIAQVAVPTMQLQPAIDHLETRIGGKSLGLRGQTRPRRLALAYGYRGAVEKQARGIQFRRVIRHAEVECLEIGKPRSELLALLHVVDCPIEAELRPADGTGTYVQ